MRTILIIWVYVILILGIAVYSKVDDVMDIYSTRREIIDSIYSSEDIQE